MKQDEIVDRIMAMGKIENRAAAKRTLKAFVSSVIDSLKSEGKISVAGLGTFKVKSTKPRTGRNPKTGETIQIAASKRVSFKPAISLKKEMKG